MKKIIFLFSAIIFFACKPESQPQIDYADLLNNCFSKNEIKLLNKGCEIFEKEILKNHDRKNIGNFYKKYVENFRKESPKEIFESIKANEYLSKLKKTDLFNKIWEKHQININNQSNKYVFELNSNGIFINCLLKNCESLNIKKVINEYKEVTGISLQILANGLTDTLTQKEFNSKIIRLFISIEFYYSLKVNL